MKRGEKKVDISLPNVGDYFDGEGRSEYVENHFADLWNAGSTESITITADKAQIVANNTDVCTVTASIPVVANYCYVTVNGPPAEKVLIENDQAIIEFVSAEVGVFRVDFYVGDKSGTIFIEVIADAQE